MGVVKRGLWAWRLFHFFKCDGVAIFAVMRKVLICLNALRHLESLFSIRPKATLFLKEASHRCEEAFCQLNIEVSSLQGLSEFNSSTVSTSYPQLVLASLHDALSASVRVKRSATNLPTSLCSQGMLRAHTTSKPICSLSFWFSSS